MKSYTIHLIRHGITQGNLLGQYIGVTDSPLAPQGAEQLRELKAKHEYPTAQAYYTSPLSRCVQTMKILYPHVQPVVIDGFRECDFGDWEGKSAKELQSNPDFIKWVENGSTASPPNGESGGVFMQRVCFAFEKLVEDMMRSGTTSAVVVAHGGTIMSILSMYGIPKAKFYDWMVESGCGYSIRITPGLWMRSMVAEVYATIPAKQEETADHTVIDLAREAANRAYGKKDT
jgi:alpha-ribazole phosphatase